MDMTTQASQSIIAHFMSLRDRGETQDAHAVACERSHEQQWREQEAVWQSRLELWQQDAQQRHEQAQQAELWYQTKVDQMERSQAVFRNQLSAMMPVTVEVPLTDDTLLQRVEQAFGDYAAALASSDQRNSSDHVRWQQQVDAMASQLKQLEVY